MLSEDEKQYLIEKLIMHVAGLEKPREALIAPFFGIRNNLVSSTEGTELRYFTDTDGGSSGSPVFNDRWEVVAVHRSAVFVEGVSFQGKPTAYVNAGTHLASILQDLRQHHPAIAAEIG